MSEGGQIFQAADPKRWRNFKWSFRVVLMIALFFIVVLVVALISGNNPSIPNLEAKSKAYQQKLDPTNPLTLSQGFNKKYKGFKDFLDKKIREDSLKNLKLFKNTQLSNIDFSLTGRNLILWTNYTGSDPEANVTGAGLSRGQDWFNNPSTKSILFSVLIRY